MNEPYSSFESWFFPLGIVNQIDPFFKNKAVIKPCIVFP